MDVHCRLCLDKKLEKIDASFKGRSYYHCNDCDLIMADKASLPDPETEKSRYLLHQNEATDVGYVRFLSQLLEPLSAYICQGSSCLDYGCGPNPVLATMLREGGHHCELYDPYFYPLFPAGKFDVIVATECFEHFHQPLMDIEKVISKLASGGILAVMTDTWTDFTTFANWHYIRDVTHVSFYHLKTMALISEHFGLKPLYSDNKRVFIWQLIA